jgi:hypothetical protein
LTENEFHVSRDDLDSQNAMEEKIMKWVDRAANHEVTPSKQITLCKLLIKRLKKNSELRIKVEKVWTTLPDPQQKIKTLLSVIGFVR